MSRESGRYFGDGAEPPSETEWGRMRFSLWQKSVLFGAAYFACAEASTLVSARGSADLSFWLPGGLYLAVLLLNDYKSWPWLVLAATAAHITFDAVRQVPAIAGFVFNSADTVQAVLGAWLVRKFVASRPTMATLREFVGLLVFAGGLSTLLAAMVSATGQVLAGMSQSFAKSFSSWLGCTTMATLIVSPFVLAWFSQWPDWRAVARQPKKVLEAAVLFAGLIASTWWILVLGRGINSPNKFPFIVFLIWAGLRFGVRGATAANLVIALLAGYCVQHYMKGLALADIASRFYLLTMQAALAAAAIVGLIPAIVLAERDKTLKQWRESEVQLRAILESTDDGILAVDNEGKRVIKFNRQFVKLWKIPQSLMDSGDNHRLLNFVREQLSEPDLFLKKVLSRYGTDAVGLDTLVFKDGRVYERAGFPMLMDGVVIGRISSFRNITERKKAEAALCKSEENFRSVFTNAPVGIFQSSGGRLVTANPALVRMFGYESATEMLASVANPDTLFVQSDERRQIVRDTLGSTTYTEHEVAYRRKDGSTFTGNLRMRAVRDEAGEFRILEGYIEDITERKRAQEALSGSEAKLRGVFECSRDAIGIALRGSHVFANPAYLSLFGFENNEQIVGTSILNHIAPSHRQQMLRNIEARAAGENIPSFYEARGVKTNGAEFDMEVSVSSFQLNGEIYTIASIRDITTRVQTEQRLQKSREQLRALSARLQSLREEERTHLAREIHDHLGQMLTALNLDLRLMEQRAASVADSEARAALQGKIASARILADEILTSVQRIATELRPAILDRLGLEAAIESETQAFESRTGVHCQWTLPSTPLALEPDQATAIFRIFQEILTNVARHAHARTLAVRLAQEEDELVLEVDDDGIGIKVDENASPASLGLLGMRERAAILGGRITFGRGERRGTKVVMQVPLQRKAGQLA